MVDWLMHTTCEKQFVLFVNDTTARGMLGSSMLMLSNSLPYDVHRNIHKMRFFNEPHPSLLSGATRVLPLVSNEVHKVHDPFQLDEGNISRPRPPSSIRDILLKEGYYYEPSATTHRPTHRYTKRPKDPDKYLAVIPYKDVYKLFNTLNQYTKPKKVATTKKPKPKTTTKTTKKPAKKDTTTKKKKKKKKKTVKHKTKVEVII